MRDRRSRREGIDEGRSNMRTGRVEKRTEESKFRGWEGSWNGHDGESGVGRAGAWFRLLSSKK